LKYSHLERDFVFYPYASFPPEENGLDYSCSEIEYKIENFHGMNCQDCGECQLPKNEPARSEMFQLVAALFICILLKNHDQSEKERIFRENLISKKHLNSYFDLYLLKYFIHKFESPYFRSEGLATLFKCNFDEPSLKSVQIEIMAHSMNSTNLEYINYMQNEILSFILKTFENLTDGITEKNRQQQKLLNRNLILLTGEWINLILETNPGHIFLKQLLMAYIKKVEKCEKHHQLDRVSREIYYQVKDLQRDDIQNEINEFNNYYKKFCDKQD
jgi:hypothetical protein